MSYRLRFSLRALAIVVGLIALGVWWMIWPQRTAESFIGLLSEGKFDEASQLAATKQDRDYLAYLAEGQETTRNFLKAFRLDSQVHRESLEMLRNDPESVHEVLQLLRNDPKLNPELLEHLNQAGDLGTKPNEPYPAVKLLDRTGSDILHGRGTVHLGIDSALFVQRGRVSMFHDFSEFE